MEQKRTGYEDEVGNFRAPISIDPEQDSSPMVQEILARIKFVTSKINIDGKVILDYGCGTGVALHWINSNFHPKKMVGIDISKGAIESAKRNYSGIDFRVIDVETPPKDLKNEFDVSLCFEVLEHLRHPDQALSLLTSYYMKPNCIVVVSTPNRNVFSGGMEQSPINRTHLHEMNINEFSNLLNIYFYKVNIYGMRFKNSKRMKAHAINVTHACDGYKLLKELWWNKWINRFYRWILRGEILGLYNGNTYYRWEASDFEFIDKPNELDGAIWFLAIASNDGPVISPSAP